MAGITSPSPRLLPHGTLRVGVLLEMVRHHWFIRMRWVIAAATIPFLLIEAMQVPNFRRPIELPLCIGALAVVNLIWTIIGHRLHRATRHQDTTSDSLVRRVTLFANAQMTVDLLLLTVILHYAGGIENPMSVFYLFHMMIAVLLLTPLNASLQGIWALALYSLLGIGECLNWFHHHPFLSSTHDSMMYTDWTYVLFGIGVLAAGVFGTLYFTYQISRGIDVQERELQDANANLMRSQLAVQDLQARRSRFMLTAAHQLKGPLAGIETLAGLIRDRIVEAESVHDIVSRIVNRCQQAILQVTELLTLARVQDAPPTKHRDASTGVVGVARKVVEQYAAAASSKSIKMHTQFDCDECVCAAADSRDLEDCVSNLVDNAIKYTPEGGSVWVTARCDDDAAIVSVRDTGMGIAEGSEDDLFDPFRRGNLALAANIPGSGLGLAIVREVMEQASGRIDVQSTVGEGSEFTLSVPLHDSIALQSTVRGTRSTKLKMRPISSVPPATNQPAD